MLKKSTLAILSLAITGLVQAGEMSSTPICVPGDVTVPCETRVWDIGIQALYLKPTYNGTRSIQTSITDGIKEVSPQWGWGYRLEGSYHFYTGNDITMNWIHYDVDSHLGQFGGGYLQILPAPLPTIFLPAPYSEFLSNKFDQVNLIMGQHVDLSLRQKTRFYAGAQYANIHLDGQRNYTISPLFLSGTSGVFGTDNTDFNGFGPLLGIDYSYALINGLSITANTAAAILYGSSRVDMSTAYGNGLVVTSIYNSMKKLVPSFEGKLGLNYSHELANGLLNIEGGYQAINYFDALRTSSFPSSLSITSNDFGLYGPYFGIKWLGSA